jgi:hypothetical protein
MLRAIEPGGEQRPNFRSTVIEVGVVAEGEYGLRCGKTVRCVHGAILSRVLSRAWVTCRQCRAGSVGMIRRVASHTFCVSQPAAA